MKSTRPLPMEIDMITFKDSVKHCVHSGIGVLRKEALNLLKLIIHIRIGKSRKDGLMII